MTTEEICNSLVFEPVVDFMSSGNRIQRCEARYKGHGIMWQTYFPWNIFEDPTDSFMVDRVVSVDTPIRNAVINDTWYTEEGYGYPIFETLEHAVEYINKLEL
jgi:hypothetical protein